MAANADSVVVELIAKTEQLDRPVQQSASNFSASMDKITASATKAEGAVVKSASTQTAAIQRETSQVSQFMKTLAGDMVGAGDLMSLPFAVPVKEAPKAGAAIKGLSSVTGVLGGVLESVTGVGLALFAASLVEMALKSGHASSEVNDLVEKLREHARQTALSEEADAIWSRTLDGLIEKHKQLNEELHKRLEVQALVDQSTFRQQQSDFTSEALQLKNEQENNRKLREQLAAHQSGSVGIGQGAQSTGVSSAVLSKQIDDSDAKIKKLEADLATLQSNINQGQVLLGQRVGEGLASLTAKAQQFGEVYKGTLSSILQNDNPVISVFSDKLFAAADALIKATHDAAGAGVEFVGVTNKVTGLDRSLAIGKITVQTYTTEVKKLAAELENMAKKAADAAKQHPTDPVKAFKESVIGAEGTGQNRMGSSAAGFGQFMPGTFETYFKRLYPDQAAGLSNAQIDDLRNKRQIAEAVISAATEDYVKVLKSAGQQITEAGLYTVHLLGEPAAKKLFAAAPQTDTRSVLGNQVVDLNPLLKGTVEQARVAIAKRIGDSSAAISAGASAVQQTLNQGAAELARSILAEKERAARFLQEKDQLEGQVIDSRRGLVVTAYESWQFETAANIAAHKRTEDQIAAEQEIGKLLPQEADELRLINNERAKYRQQLVDQRLRQAQAAQAEQGYQRGRDFQTAAYGAEAELLQSEEALAKTAGERRQIERRLINLQFEEEKLKNQYVIDWAERVKANKDATEKEKADAQLAENIAKMHQETLPQRQQNAQKANDNRSSPLKSWINDASDLDTALENIAVHGLDDLSSGIADAVLGFKSWGDVARQVLADMAKMLIEVAVKILIIKGLQALGLGLAGGGKVGLAQGGRPRGYANAGLIIGPGGPTSDVIPIMASAGEYMIREKSAQSIGYGNLDYINRTGHLPPHYADGGQIQAIRPTNMPLSVPGSRNGFSPGDIRELRGIVHDAIRAMPDIKLYPTIDSGDVVKRGINTTHGSRALLAHVTDNSTKYKGGINRP